MIIIMIIVIQYQSVWTYFLSPYSVSGFFQPHDVSFFGLLYRGFRVPDLLPVKVKVKVKA